MRGNVIMILLACLVVVVSVFLVVWINNGAQELLALCDRIDEAVREAFRGSGAAHPDAKPALGQGRHGLAIRRHS